MYARYLMVIGLIAASSIFSGCAQRETMLDRNWGRSYESAKFNQILNPEAGKNLEPVVGLDGQAADTALESYRKQFGQAKETTFTFSVTGKD
jgi:hypothetical protein